MLRTEKYEAGRFEGWRVRVHPSRSIATPAVWGDRVVFGGGFGSHEVYAVDAATGELAWELKTRDDGPTAATVVDGIAFLNTESCTLEAIDVATGALLWEKWLGDPLLAQPAARAGRVLMVWPRAGRHFLGAFEVRTGTPLWETEVAADVISAPVMVGDHAWVTTYDGSVTCVDVASGERLWTKPMLATSAPWVLGDRLFVAQRRAQARAERAGRESRDGAARPEAAASAEAPLERITTLDSVAGEAQRSFSPKLAAYLAASHGTARKVQFASHDAAVGFGHAPAAAKLHLAEGLVGEGRVSRAWRYQGSRPVVWRGTLFETAGDHLEATDIETGRRLWQWGEAVAEEGERRLTPAAVSNGRVLVGTWDGRLVSLDAADGTVRWDADVGAPVHWQPTMVQGRVFAGLEDGSVVCLHTRDALDDGWPMWGGGPGHNGLAEAGEATAPAGSMEHAATSAAK